MVPVAFEHFSTLHPEFGLKEINVRDYLEAEDRLSPVRPRVEDVGAVEGEGEEHRVPGGEVARAERQV